MEKGKIEKEGKINLMHCTCSYKIIPDLPDLHYIQVGLVRLSISHVFPIILDINSPKQLIK